MGLYADLNPTWDIDYRYIKLIWGFDQTQLLDDHTDNLLEAARELSMMLTLIIMLMASTMIFYYALLRPKLAKACKRSSSRLAKYQLIIRRSISKPLQQGLLSIAVFAIEHCVFVHLLSASLQAIFLRTFAGRVLFLEMKAGWMLSWIAVALHLLLWKWFARARCKYPEYNIETEKA